MLVNLLLAAMGMEQVTLKDPPSQKAKGIQAFVCVLNN